MKRAKRTPFERLVSTMPMCLSGGLDLLGQHHNASDLHYSAQHELDLHDEGEIHLTPRQIAVIKQFMERCKAQMKIDGND